MGQLRENHKITNMSYQKAAVDDIESSTRSNKTPPNTPKKSQRKKYLGIAGAIALLIVIATAIGYGIHANQSKCQNDGTLIEINGNFSCNCNGTGFEGKQCELNSTLTKPDDSDDPEDDQGPVTEPPTSQENCVWGSWTSWSSCSKSCGDTGEETRSRTKTTTERNGGTCSGTGSDSRPCSTPLPPCPENCVWGLWSTWGSCSETCGSGIETRSRTKINTEQNGGNCPESDSDSKACNTHSCGVKKVRMTVPSGSSGWPECGGASNEKIKIKISEYRNCTTEAIRYEAGEVNIDWTEDLLLDCAGIKTDPTEQSLRVIVMPTVEDEGTPSRYCLNFLEVVLNDGTIYRNDSVDKKYRYGNGNGDSEVILNKV